MTYDIKLSNIDSNFLDIIKSLVKIYPNVDLKIDSDYTFDDLNDETKDIISNNLKNKSDGTLLSNYDDIKKFIMS
ncbi:hypothetical protein F1B92_02025 [Campylobacter sp. FMV-PI01]|uniref:Uncharacterized protein n=1 Tax=Campylobacter portucalensis TaxID=2608384 RepID=A0A6L5WHS1_9BACT|nr:hypothetical protein [Campylobacter portucalensis]MSN95982.1 hypothetical protein [Campylobacter portucalensis]